jgi:hypothetical protein
MASGYQILGQCPSQIAIHSCNEYLHLVPPSL